jgi:hypothetical protein
MRLDIHITSKSELESIKFYVHELMLFERSHEFGIGNILLRNVENPDFCLLLSPNQSPSIERPLFSISTEKIDTVVANLNQIQFSKGGPLRNADGSIAVMDYPLGKNISLRDPSDNFFLISEWHQSVR